MDWCSSLWLLLFFCYYVGLCFWLVLIVITWLELSSLFGIIMIKINCLLGLITRLHVHVDSILNPSMAIQWMFNALCMECFVLSLHNTGKQLWCDFSIVFWVLNFTRLLCCQEWCEGACACECVYASVHKGNSLLFCDGAFFLTMLFVQVTNAFLLLWYLPDTWVTEIRQSIE